MASISATAALDAIAHLHEGGPCRSGLVATRERGLAAGIIAAPPRPCRRRRPAPPTAGIWSMPLPLGSVAAAPRDRTPRASPACLAATPRRASAARSRPRRRDRARRHRRKVDLHLGVAQRRAPERRLADDVAELGPAARVQVAAVGEQEVELPLGAQRAPQLGDRLPQPPRLPGIAVGEAARSCSIIQQNACSLSVSPSGSSTRSRRCFTCGRVPLCANVKWRPHNTRLNGCVFSSDARPRVLRRTCAIASSVLIGCLRMNSAIDAGARGRGFQEAARELAVVERQTPAVGVRPGLPAAQRETCEREHDVRGDVALHPQ